MAKKDRGTDPSYLIEQLRQGGHDDLLRAIGAGEITPHAAAISAGIRKREKPPPGGVDIATRRQRLLKMRKRALGLPERIDGTQLQELWIGPGKVSAFPDDGTRLKAWRRCRGFLMSNAGGGHRCWGFWNFESPVPYPGHAAEPATLYALGLMGELEQREFLPIWRQTYDHVAALRGVAAIRDALDQACLPYSLLCRWNGERRRAAKRIRALGAVVSEPGAERTGAPR